MKYKILLVLAALAIGAFAGCGGNTATNSSNAAAPVQNDRAETIVNEFLKRDAAPYRKMRVRFTIRVENEADKVYEVDNWRKQSPETTLTLSQIVKPADESDLATLALEPAGQKATLTTYAASRDEYRDTDTNKMFFGGLTAGELLGEWKKYDFKFLGEKDRDGVKVSELEGSLKPGMNATAAKMNVLFRQDDYLPAEINLFDSSGKAIRTYKVTEYKSDAKGAYASKTEVDNPIYKAKITIEILDRQFPEKADDALFTREKLKQIVKK